LQLFPGKYLIKTSTQNKFTARTVNDIAICRTLARTRKTAEEAIFHRHPHYQTFRIGVERDATGSGTHIRTKQHVFLCRISAPVGLS